MIGLFAFSAPRRPQCRARQRTNTGRNAAVHQHRRADHTARIVCMCACGPWQPALILVCRNWPAGRLLAGQRCDAQSSIQQASSRQHAIHNSYRAVVLVATRSTRTYSYSVQPYRYSRTARTRDSSTAVHVLAVDHHVYRGTGRYPQLYRS
jgi:hypothetical protein